MELSNGNDSYEMIKFFNKQIKKGYQTDTEENVPVSTPYWMHLR